MNFDNYIKWNENRSLLTKVWEQRKLSELVLIERGGSPRPIDDYITDAPDGLNWVKIKMVYGKRVLSFYMYQLMKFMVH